MHLALNVKSLLLIPNSEEPRELQATPADLCDVGMKAGQGQGRKLAPSPQDRPPPPAGSCSAAAARSVAAQAAAPTDWREAGLAYVSLQSHAKHTVSKPLPRHLQNHAVRRRHAGHLGRVVSKIKKQPADSVLPPPPHAECGHI